METRKTRAQTKGMASSLPRITVPAPRKLFISERSTTSRGWPRLRCVASAIPMQPTKRLHRVGQHDRQLFSILVLISDINFECRPHSPTLLDIVSLCCVDILLMKNCIQEYVSLIAFEGDWIVVHHVQDRCVADSVSAHEGEYLIYVQGSTKFMNEQNTIERQ